MNSEIYLTPACTSACRYCRFYRPEGRRGGTCQRLGVPVQANWKACSLGSPPFTAEDQFEIPQLPRIANGLSVKATIPEAREVEPAVPQVQLV
ncbi:MAG: hypothetical protein ACFB4I_11450 [Cyanophyceae cyanobacterium]